MKKPIVTLVLVLLISFVSCKTDKTEATDASGSEKPLTEKKMDVSSSQNSLDWKGTYMGVLPCADCEGIKTTIQLQEDLTYKKTSEYLGKDATVFEDTGYYKWLEGGQNILLSDENETTYQVGENKLTLLDQSGDPITGELADKYILQKQDANAIAFTDTKWKLVALFGKEITNSEAFISFATENNKVFGHSGCNNFNGTFQVENETQLSLSKMVSTMKACPNMDVENQFMSALEKVDNFSLNGSKMTLNKARMAPLAVFEAVK
ncbi:copper resistance protein NlpE N-terminal domain-containing protein [Bizionia sp. KMM 8389]